MSDALLEGDVFIVITNLSFCGWCVDWFRQFVGLFQSFRQFDAAYSAVFFITFPAASCNVAAHDTFDREHFKLAAHHAVAVKLWLLEKFRHIFYINRNHVVRKNIFCQIKPEFGHLSKYRSFFGYDIFQNNIEAADAVSCNHDQTVAVVINLANFTFFNRFHCFSTHNITSLY